MTKAVSTTSVSTPDPTKESAQNPFSAEAIRRAHKEGLEPNLRRQLDFIGVHDDRWRGLEIEVLGATNPTLPFWRNGRVFASSVDAAVRLVAEADRQHGADGVYLRANVINPVWIAQRGTDIWMASRTGQGTGNVDIVYRRYAFADFDPERGEHASATQQEMLHALKQARHALGACAQVLGTDKPFGLGMSGNGAHTAFKLGDLPNTDAVEDLLWGLLNGLAHRFGDTKLKGDLSVCDARRLTPAFGSVKRKGEDMVDRPHRRTFFVCHPDAVGLTLDQLRQLHTEFAVSGAARRGGSKRDRGQYLEDSGSVWHRCGQVNIRDVAGRLGIDTDNPRCPVCDGGEGGRGSASSCCYLDEKLGINIIKCHHATCGQRAFGPVGLVAQVVAGTDTLRGNKDACANVLQWFEENFGIKDESPPEAYEGDGESMMVDWHEPEPTGVFETAAPKLAMVTQLPGTDERPTIVVSTQQEQVINQAIKALGRDERVYQRGLKLVRVLASDQGDHTIRVIALPTLSEKLSSAANWRRQGEEGKTSPVLPPSWAVRGLYERGQWRGMRPLRGVIDTPVLRPDGTVLFTPGYDPKTGLLLRPTIDFGSIPEHPTREDAVAALAELMEVVEDFPFETAAHRAAWVAAVLTAFCLYAMTGAIPMFPIDGNVRGAGKGLLADTIGIITTGKLLPAQGHVRDDAEIEKRITALALQGGGPHRIDNVRGGFGGAIWEAAVTARTWLSRILGTTETVKPPLDILWVVTGNNIEFTGDMPRRTVPIRLASEEERPEDRTGFKHPQLAAWVQQERARLVRAALTILRAYFVAGKPEQKGVVFGTFEEWAGTVASALVWLGQPDVCKNRLALEQNEDSDSVKLSGLMTAWGQAFGNTPLFLREVLERIAAEDQRVARRDNVDGPHELLALRGAIVELCSRDGKLPSAPKVGKTMRHFLKRNVGGRRFETELDTHSGTHRWRLVRLDGEAIEAAVPEPGMIVSDEHEYPDWNERLHEV